MADIWPTISPSVPSDENMVPIAAAAIFPYTFHTAAVAAADGTVGFVQGLTGVTVFISGMNGDTIVFKGSKDGTTWYDLMACNLSTGATATGATVDGAYLVPVPGITYFIVDLTVRVGGTITAKGNGFVSTSDVTLADIVGTVTENIAQWGGINVLSGNGVTGTGSPRVTIASNNTPFPVKTDLTTPGTTDAISVARLGANTVSVGNGVTGTGVLRVAQVSDGTGRLATVDQVTLIPTVTTVETVTTVTNPVAVTNAALAVVGGGAEATALRVTLANDSTGLVSVDDGGGSLTTDSAQLPAALGGGAEVGALLVTLANDSTGLVSVDDNGGSLTVDNAALAVVGGGAEATALRVTLANDSTGLVSVDDGGGAITVDWAGTAPPIGAGVEATALRVTLATDSTGLVSVDDGGGSLTTDSAQLPAALGGGAEAGALLVTLASDSTGLVSVDDNGGSLTVDNAALSLTGAGTEAGVLRVTLANDSTGLVSVDDNGGSLTVDGTVGITETATTAAGSGTYAASLVAKAAAGTLYTLSGYNSGPAQWIQIHNTTAVPADAVTPLGTFKVANDANFSIDFGSRGLAMGTGITVCNSTTGATKTIGAADTAFLVGYV